MDQASVKALVEKLRATKSMPWAVSWEDGQALLDALEASVTRADYQEAVSERDQALAALKEVRGRVDATDADARLTVRYPEVGDGGRLTGKIVEYETTGAELARWAGQMSYQKRQ